MSESTSPNSGDPEPLAHHVMRERGTEPPFSGKLLHNKEKGVYSCAGCATELFRSDAKYDSGSGWPSFFEPIEQGRVRTETDSSLGMMRTEVICAKCEAHLGHVFTDGPFPTGLRYCVNSAALQFSKEGREDMPA